MSRVITRFAPSPTGYLHVGGARTALFNFLFARHENGSFILRIEDTDQKRSTKEFTDDILDNLKWLGLTWDNGPVFQSQRREIYERFLDSLKEKGRIYYCTCTPAELEEMRRQAAAAGQPLRYSGKCRNRQTPPANKDYVVRFAIPTSGSTQVKDAVKGDVSFANEELDDFIIMRSDGSFTYNFVVVADDIDLGITHIVRGDDHLNNTPKQLLLYQALGVAPPLFAHVPLALGPDRAKLSKRHGHTAVKAYREEGFLPQALVNFLARLGWSFGDQEIFSLDELIAKFTLEGVGKAAGIFDRDKLLWLNAHYLKNEAPLRLAELSTPFFAGLGLPAKPDETLVRRVLTLKERSRTLKELAEIGAFYYREEVEMDETAAAKFLVPEIKPIFIEIARVLESVAPFEEAGVEAAVMEFIKEKEIKLKRVAQPLRVALTGGTASPGLFEMMAALGRDATVKRILNAADRIKVDSNGTNS